MQKNRPLSLLTAGLWLSLLTPTAVATAEEADVQRGTVPPQLRATEALSQFGMVATGSPEATEAAVAVLENGGNAIDAAVTAALVLGVADSDASGIGGATYMVIRPASGRATTINGVSQTPGHIDLERFRAAKAAGDKFGYGMVAVPTTLAVLDEALRVFGTISMADALGPAIEVAERGYSLSPLQIKWTTRYYEEITGTSEYLASLVMKDGMTIGEPGDIMPNPDLAQTLRILAKDGVQSFYRGAIADRIEADMAENHGHLRKTDLAMLRIRREPPISTTYRGIEVLSVPSPGGGESLLGALNILETFPPDFLAENSVARHHAVIESIRIARADRASSGAGLLPGKLPGNPHLSKRHARDRAQMILPGKAIPKEALVGDIDPDCLPEGESTTQVSIIDAQGNSVSLTQTLGRSFGSKVATPGLGFPYNSFLESFKVDKPHCPSFLRPHGPCGTDMAPTILVRDGHPVLALGTPGSSRIPSILAGIISHVVDRGMGLREAVEAPRVLWGGFSSINIELEITPPLSEDLIGAFNAMGYQHPVESVSFPAPPLVLIDFGGVNAVGYDPTSGTFVGVVDPRRSGLAMGPRAEDGDD